jgi:surface antigen
LLSETQGVEANYQNKISSEKKKITELQAQQAAEIAARTRGSSYFGTGEYPWANVPFPSFQADDWGFYLRQCTSYAAWKRAAVGRPIPAWGRMGWADAKAWPGWAAASGLRVDHTPEVNAIGVFTGGAYGHVMIVKSISGSQVLVSQYNADFTGRYSESYWDIASLVFIH